MRLCFAALGIVLAAAAQGEAISCRGYPESVKARLKPRIEALRLLEREAADRLRGLDTRTFPYLAGEARKTADLIGDVQALKDEEAFDQCRDAVPPVRRICRGAALSLATAIDKEEAGVANKESRQAYADAMPRCEQLLGLSPLSTAWRSID